MSCSERFPDLALDHGFVLACLRQFGVPTAELEDAAQDTLLVAHRRRDSFRSGESIRPWLFGIARRVAFRYRRSAERRAKLSRALAAQPVVAASLDVEFARSEGRELLDRFVGALGPGKRDVFVLAELRGLSGREVAEALGLTPSTVWSRLRAAQAEFGRFVAQQRARHQRSGSGHAERPQAAVARGKTPLGAVALSPWGSGWRVLVAGFKVRAWVALRPAAVATLLIVGAGSGASHSGLRAAQQVITRYPKSKIVVAAAPVGVVRAKLEPGTPRVKEPVSTTIAPVNPVVQRPRSAPRAARPRRSVAPAPSVSSLAAEAALLRRIRAAVLSRDGHRALELIQVHERQFSDGLLVRERDALRVGALCALGHEAGAQRLAARIATRHPDPRFLAVARSGCTLSKSRSSKVEPSGE